MIAFESKPVVKDKLVLKKLVKYEPMESKPLEIIIKDELVTDENVKTLECKIVKNRYENLGVSKNIKTMKGKTIEDETMKYKTVECENMSIESSLLKQQKEDPMMFVQPLINPNSNRLSEMQTMQCIEFINALIHKAVTFSSNMSEVAKALELHIEKKELNKNENNMCSLIPKHYYNIQEAQIYNHLQKKIDYGHIMGHFKKVLNYLLEDNNQNDLDKLILSYIAKKKTISGGPSNKRLKASNKDKSKSSNSKTQIVVYNNVESDNSKIDTNRHKCRLCYKKGHYALRCSNKKNKQI
ncbi:9670_t:CDS:2 [Cetraspora pellucida]|uniref:9670_t:CDS:1 n=1 Tax=Cetraspora pellucida TaxID=1433469 RepID=A0A9N8WHK7_9GLOM|nr:9670_t:CDS:2 [Cetraspora pellucida]